MQQKLEEDVAFVFLCHNLVSVGPEEQSHIPEKGGMLEILHDGASSYMASLEFGLD